jgi:hypothetical protein
VPPGKPVAKRSHRGPVEPTGGVADCAIFGPQRHPRPTMDPRLHHGANGAGDLMHKLRRPSRLRGGHGPRHCSTDRIFACT